MNTLIHLWYFLRPLIDLLGTIALALLMLFGTELFVVWIIKTFYKVFILIGMGIFALISILLIISLVDPELIHFMTTIILPV